MLINSESLLSSLIAISVVSKSALGCWTRRHEASAYAPNNFQVPFNKGKCTLARNNTETLGDNVRDIMERAFPFVSIEEVSSADRFEAIPNYRNATEWFSQCFAADYTKLVYNCEVVGRNLYFRYIPNPASEKTANGHEQYSYKIPRCKSTLKVRIAKNGRIKVTEVPKFKVENAHLKANVYHDEEIIRKAMLINFGILIYSTC